MIAAKLICKPVFNTLHELRNASVDTVIGLEAPATSDHSPLEKQQVQQL
jgi:hypothetical protein